MRRFPLEFWLGLGLVGITLAGLGGVCANGFVNFDDNEYVYDNEKVQAGLTPESVRWAVTTFHSANWHPLTWISLQLDAQLYGVQSPWGFHLTNLALHVANTLLLFWVLRRMTAATVPSALVAALFAVHPLHVESVAWVSERKDVLSTLFWMLTLLAYARYVERPGVNRYLLIVLAFALGLMAKPMLVTLPCVLLLLDYWPLGRLRQPSGLQTGLESYPTTPRAVRAIGKRLGLLLLEKIPLFALTAASVVITLQAQKEAVVQMEYLPIEFRVANALVAYVAYVGKMIWPAGLAPLYLHPRSNLPGWQASGAFLLLVILSGLFLLGARRRPFLMVGWLWYLGTLVPVLGLVQVGNQAMADRFTYVPLIGLFILVSWGVFDVSAGWRRRGPVLALGACGILGTLTVCSCQQVSYWHDSVSLWQRTIAVTGDNAVAHRNLAIALWVEGQRDEAILHFAEVFRIRPDVEARDNLQAVYYVRGNDYDMQGRLDEAFRYYEATIRINPNNEAAHNAMGTVCWRQGKLDQAAGHYLEALRINPAYKEAEYNLGILLIRQGKLAEARYRFTETIRIDPRFARAHDSLGTAFALEGKWAEAVICQRRAVDLAPPNVQFLAGLALACHEKGDIEKANAYYRQVLQLDPDWLATTNRDAWALATHGNPGFRHGTLAILLAQEVCQACRAAGRPLLPQYLETLAAGYAEAGRWEDAVKTGLEARDRARSANDDKLARQIEDTIRLYRLKQPGRDELIHE